MRNWQELELELEGFQGNHIAFDQRVYVCVRLRVCISNPDIVKALTSQLILVSTTSGAGDMT